MRKLPLTAAEELLEIIMRRYERASTLLNIESTGGRLGQTAGRQRAVSAMLDRLLHHGHVLKCGPRSWRTKTAAREKANDKSKSKNKSDLDAGQRTPGGVATRDPEASPGGASP